MVAKAHPKERFIGVGLPEWMGDEVEEWTAARRAQKGDAWFNYQPGVADRDTIELLLETSAQATSPAVDPARVGRHPALRVAPDDGADLQLILTVLRAFHQHKALTGSLKKVKPLREILFFQWEEPRLPQGGKYSRHLPHSPDARARRRSTGGTKGLVYEHVAPIAGLIRSLLQDLPPDEQALRHVLESTSDRVIVTRDEDATLTAAGFGSSAPDPKDPWSRYRAALDLQRSDFAPFDPGD